MARLKIPSSSENFKRKMRFFKIWALRVGGFRDVYNQDGAYAALVSAQLSAAANIISEEAAAAEARKRAQLRDHESEHFYPKNLFRLFFTSKGYL